MGSDSMTGEQYIERLNKLLNRASENVVKGIMTPAANELLANIKNRIVVDGNNANDQKIGDYSTTPAYYTRDQFDAQSGFSSRGKESKDNFKNGNQRKSMYFEDGYKGLREIQGKPVDKMNLNYSGSTMAAYQQFADEEQILQGMNTKIASLIRQGHEERKDMKIYNASKKELEAYNKNVAEEFTRVNLEILSGV